MSVDIDPDCVADCVINAFNALPPHRKPRQAGPELKAGRREWVPLAGIVIDSGSNEPPAKRLKCAALATGMKCLPQDKIQALQGNVVHDSHAEILALRAFNRFLLDQCAHLVERRVSDDENNSAENFLEWRKTPNTKPRTEKAADHTIHDLKEPSMRSHFLWREQPFALRSNVKIHMYCSEAPCGDASMELTMAAQDDSTPWIRTPTAQTTKTASDYNPLKHKAAEVSLQNVVASPSSDQGELYGRSYFDVLGVVRRKPSRPDAPPTLSKSCSDKLALKQCTSSLSTMTSLLIHPENAYIHSLILPRSQYVEKAFQRAFGPDGRMAPLTHCWDEPLVSAGYCYKPFRVQTTTREFDFSRRSASTPNTTLVPSNISSLIHGSHQETLINGVLQGRKQADPRGASAVSRRKLWSLALRIATLIGENSLIQVLAQPTYHGVKRHGFSQARETAKSTARQGALKGWKRNSGDDTWSL